MVIWVDGAIADPVPATDAAVRAAEDALRVFLPADFLAIARVRQGAAPCPNGIDLPNGFVTGVAHLLHFADSPFVSNIVAARFPVEGLIEKGVIPFAVDSGGDLFCFSYRQDYDAPPVVHWSVDGDALPLAPSFTAFLGLLHD